MKVLHIIKSRQSDLIKKIIDQQSKKNELKVINLAENNMPYEDIIDEIFFHDKVISW